MHQPYIRKRANKKKRTVKAQKKSDQKRNPKPRIKKQVNVWSGYSNNRQLMDETIQEISEQLRYMEIKMAIEQFMVNQTMDQLQRKGILNEQEIKNMYSNTYRFWQEEMKGKGDPFRDIDLDVFPLQESYRMKLREVSREGSNPSYNSLEKGELTKFITQLKEEMKGLKKEMIRRKIQNLKQFPRQQERKDTD